MKHLACELSTLKKHRKMRIFIESTPILVAYIDGDIYAVNDKCPHMRASLYKGTIDSEGVVTCQAHKAKIDMKSGRIQQKAKIAFLPLPTKKTRAYSVSTDEGKVYVDA